MTQSSGEFVADNQISRVIGDGKHQIRQGESASDQELLNESVAQHGILVPLLFHQLADGKIRPIDGHRRLCAAKANGLTSVPGYVFPEDVPELDCLSIALTTNAVRKDLTLLEKYQGVWRHHTEGQLSIAESSHRCGLSQSAGTKILAAVQNNPEDVILAFTKHGASYRALYALTKCPTPNDKRALARRFLTGELNVCQLEEQIHTRFGKRNGTRSIRLVVKSAPTYEAVLNELARLKKRVLQLQRTEIDAKLLPAHLRTENVEGAK